MDYVDFFRDIFDGYQIGSSEEKVFKQVLKISIDRFDGELPDISANNLCSVVDDSGFVAVLKERYPPKDSTSDDIEFHHFAQEWFSKKILEKWKDTFAEYDLDNSGSLEKEELESFLAILGQIGEREQEIKKKLEECDTDGKEGISFEELGKFVESEIKDKLDPIMERFVKKAIEDYWE